MTVRATTDERRPFGTDLLGYAGKPNAVTGPGIRRGSRRATLWPMSDELIEIARWLERQPWNQPGTDKTWVFRGALTALRFWSELRRVDPARAG